MKIEEASLSFVKNVVATAELVKISNIIIEPGKVRAIDDQRTVVIFQDTNVPLMSFGSIGINRLEVFTARFDIAKSIENFEMDATVEGLDKAFVRAITMKAKGIKIDYRCANPATIQAPKSINDVIKFKVKMTSEAVTYMQKAHSAMGSDEISLIGTGEGVFFELVDINNDKLTYKFADTITNMVDTDTSNTFVYKYPLKTLQILFKYAANDDFFLTSKGMLKVCINNLNIYGIPKT